MRNFKSGLCLAGLLAVSLSACSRFRETKDITQVLKEGVVKITYGNKPGHATGFFIEGRGDNCTVLTVAHAVPEDLDIRVTAHDSDLFEVTQIQRAENDDLAVMTFETAGQANCPYTALNLGDSERVKIDDVVRMAGYPERAGAERLVLQFPSGKVTNIESPPLPDGYAISYDMTAVGGMSGAPVVNAKGKVVGVHGLTDIELVSLVRAQQSSLSEAQKDEIEEAEERIETRINHFKWGIPIQTFRTQRSALVSNAETLTQQDLEGKNEADTLFKADTLI
ncbi:MAG: serine protease [Cyanobacteria bacterium P01_F01_bin.53]